MFYLNLVFICNTLLFMSLMEDKFKLLPASIVSFSTFVLSLISTGIVKSMVSLPALQDPVVILVNVLLLLAASLFIHQNPPAQKVFLATLCFSNYFFLSLFTELLLGGIPLKVAGAFGAVFAVFVYVLFSLLLGLCLHNVFHHFSDKGLSFHMILLSLLQITPILFCNGTFDFIFKTQIAAYRVLASAAIYVFVLFFCRSLYSISRFREIATNGMALQNLIKTESFHYIELSSCIQRALKIQAENDYALETISFMAQNNDADQIPQFIQSIQRTHEDDVVLKYYSDNPYLNAVIASNAAFAAESDIEFESNATLGESILSTSEICIITNELLHKACTETASLDRHRRIRFSVTPAQETIRFEVIFSASAESKTAFSLSEHSFSSLLSYLFTEKESDDLSFLACTEELVDKYSGSLSVSDAGENTIIRVIINC
jgi:hypothetical protein